jgi:hypothetical protein
MSSKFITFSTLNNEYNDEDLFIQFKSQQTSTSDNYTRIMGGMIRSMFVDASL